MRERNYSSPYIRGIMVRDSFHQILLLCIAASAACTPHAGEGGAASLVGQVEVERRVVISNPASYVRYPAADVDVYITYGDRVGPDDKVTTNYDGEFAFYGLMPGTYTVYVYSKDTLPQMQQAPDIPILREVDIDGRRDQVDLGTLRIFKEL